MVDLSLNRLMLQKLQSLILSESWRRAKIRPLCGRESESSRDSVLVLLLSDLCFAPTRKMDREK
jgi:hypothetical protein